MCRQDSTRRINKRQPVHKLEDDDDEEDEEDEVTSVYSFNTLYNLKAMESEHIRPLRISTTATSQVHKVNVEVDTGADCNVMPVYLFSKIFGSKQPESSDARIQAYGGMPVTIVGKCTVIIHKSDGTQTSAVFQVTHHNGHAIIGRSTSRDIGYVNLPAIECPPNRRHLRPDRGTTPDDNEPDQMADREPRGQRRSALESHAPRRLRYNQQGEPSY